MPTSTTRLALPTSPRQQLDFASIRSRLLHRLLKRTRVCPHDAEDIAQDALLRIYERWLAGASCDELLQFAQKTVREALRAVPGP